MVDCAALPASLLEAELFGHARGAFTGAVAARAGSFEAADGGTLFLDEIGELPLSMQPKLLRVLDSMTIRRLGETAYRQVDFRVVAATNRDLRQMVNAGAFREDLYFRLAVLPVTLPALRERPTDIPLLVRHLLAGRAPPALNIPELQTMPWLGNVRELFNYVQRCCTLGDPEPPASRRAGSPPASVLDDAPPRRLAYRPSLPARSTSLSRSSASAGWRWGKGSTFATCSSAPGITWPRPPRPPDWIAPTSTG